MSEGDLMLKIIGLVILVANGVTAWTLITGRGQRRDISPQPFEVRASHEHVTRPEFERHEEEIWKVVNGLRINIGNIATDIAAIRVLRDENGKRIERLDEHVGEMRTAIGELTQALHDANNRRA